MASPFPGMDPYLEKHWGDVHHSFITYARDQLQSKLPADLRARTQERVYLEEEFKDGRSMYPDVYVVERPRQKPFIAPSEEFATGEAGGVAVAPPLRVTVTDEPLTEGYIEIIDLSDNRKVVTMIEVLSPSNKFAGTGKTLYREKQRDCQKAEVNLVEIDLLRDGPWTISVPEHLVPSSHRSTYRICVFRAHYRFPCWDIFAATIRLPLPNVAVPLRKGEADVYLELQPILDQCYQNGRYDDIDYEQEPEPPLKKDDAKWADALLRERGLRAKTARKKSAGNGKRARKKKP